jgi:lipopolysaccharide/colanic/teichoic acid biosynthesis glycosyltransferase
MSKRIFDIVVSTFLLILLSPFFIIFSIWIKLDSTGPVFFKQERIGKNFVPFFILKFRTMFLNADEKGLLTIGSADERITKSGAFLRKYKMDELPQLFNVLKNDMSLVGPRPEVRKYVELYSQEQREVLQIKPGITDWASIHYAEENRLLAQFDNPETIYVEEIMPAKLRSNLEYIQQQSFFGDLRIIGATIKQIFSR